MKKFLKYFAILLMLVLPTVSFALDFRFGDQPSVKKSEKITNDLYITGGNITSAGNIPGDLIAAGGNVIITGDVGADVMAGGGTISILSDVGDDVRAGGGTVIVQGKIAGDLIVGGGQISINGAGIGGDAVIGGGNINIDAPIKGDLKIGGGNVYINSLIEGNVKIVADKVTLGSEAVISGNLTYKANKELIKEEGAIINGKISFEPRTDKNISKLAIATIFSAFLVWKFFALLASALLIGIVFHRYNKEIVALSTKRPFFELGRGVVVFASIPIISILLFITLVGIPLGILGLIGLVVMTIFAWIIAPVIVGSVVYRYFSKKELEVSWKTILFGVFLYSLLGMIPFIGHIIQILLMFLSLGAITALKIQIVKEWR